MGRSGSGGATVKGGSRSSIDRAPPTTLISIVAGLAFVGFAAWTLRGDTLDDEETARAEQSRHGPIVAASVAFFLAIAFAAYLLASLAAGVRIGASFPGLDAVLSEIELRVEVELAKAGQF